MSLKNKIITEIMLVAVVVAGVYFYLKVFPGTPSVAIMSPAEGDVLTVSSTYTIRWSTKNVPAGYKIAITIRRMPPPPLPEEGQEFDPIVFTDLENTGSHEWTVSGMYPAGTYELGISAYKSVPVTEGILGESGHFRIEKMTIGGQTDEHGCLIPAGFSWCAERSKCIRQGETYCTAALAKTVMFVCDAAKSITATFYPSDDTFVDLRLSDGRSMSVPHARSGSGARYANTDESFVFWNKGDTAFITEGTTTSAETFSNCKL